VHSNRTGQWFYTKEQRARIHEVYAAARLSGVPMAQAAKELSLELDRTQPAVEQQLYMLLVREKHGSALGPQSAAGRGNAVVGHNTVEQMQDTPRELATVNEV
jgi:hypothetical protein